MNDKKLLAKMKRGDLEDRFRAAAIEYVESIGGDVVVSGPIKLITLSGKCFIAGIEMVGKRPPRNPPQRAKGEP